MHFQTPALTSAAETSGLVIRDVDALWQVHITYASPAELLVVWTTGNAQTGTDLTPLDPASVGSQVLAWGLLLVCFLLCHLDGAEIHHHSARELDDS